MYSNKALTLIEKKQRHLKGNPLQQEKREKRRLFKSYRYYHYFTVQGEDKKGFVLSQKKGKPNLEGFDIIGAKTLSQLYQWCKLEGDFTLFEAVKKAQQNNPNQHQKQKDFIVYI